MKNHVLLAKKSLPEKFPLSLLLALLDKHGNVGINLTARGLPYQQIAGLIYASHTKHEAWETI